jgi:hypothetical protein
VNLIALQPELFKQKRRSHLKSLLLLLSVFLPTHAISGAQEQGAALAKDDPVAAYEDAIRPFEIVRNAPQNWSEIELSALAAARKRAKESCIAIRMPQLEKSQLIPYARLCAFGEMWESVYGASERYLAVISQQSGTSDQEDVHGRGIGLGLQVQADLRLGKPEDAARASRTMLRTLPYDLYTAEALSSTINYLRWSEPEKALALQQDRQPMLLTRLRNVNTKDEINGTPLEVSPSELYREAIMLPTMLQAEHNTSAAKTQFDILESSLPSLLSPKEGRIVYELRSRYRLLDTRLPAIKTGTWLLDVKNLGKHPVVSAPGATTVLFVFPDWCIQCLTLRPQLIAAWQRLRHDEIRFFALLAQDSDVPVAPDQETAASRKTLTGRNDAAPRLAPFPGQKPDLPHFDIKVAGDNSPASLLAGTPTFVVPSETLGSFFSSEIPFFVVTDEHGIVRVVQAADSTALDPGGTLDQMVSRIAHQQP